MFTSLFFGAGTFDSICLLVIHQRHATIKHRAVLSVTFSEKLSAHSKPRKAASVLAP